MGADDSGEETSTRPTVTARHVQDDVASDDALSTVADGAAATAQRQKVRLPRGSAVGRYIVLDRLGKGGMGVVYKAYDPELDRQVAVKVVRVLARSDRAEFRARDRLLREAQALAQLSHPNVIAVYDVGTCNDDLYIAMELVEGKTLKKWLHERKPTRREVIEVCMAAGRGLAAAHRARLAHRDFKPENVIVGDDGRVRVLDFGLARALDPDATLLADTGDSSLGDSSSDLQATAGDGDPTTAAARPTSGVELDELQSGERRLREPLTEVGRVMGTPRYMAPEQHLGEKVDELSDQFSFCVVLYEALYGKRPFLGGSRFQLKHDVTTGRIQDPPAGVRIPKRLRRLVLRGLSVSRAERYPNMDALLQELAKEPGAIRRRVVYAGVVAALAGIALFGLLRSAGNSSAMCAGGRRNLVGAWDDKVGDRVHAAFLATGRPYADDTFRRVDEALRAYGDSWVAAYRDACEATHVRGSQSETLLDLRMRCLDQKLDELRALTDLFAGSTDAALLNRAVQAVSGLGAVQACADVEALTAQVPVPSDPEVQTRVAAVRKKLARVRALAQAGRYEDGLALASGVTADARDTHYPVVIAEALLQLSRMQQQTGDVESAEATLKQTVPIASRAKYDKGVALALVELVDVVGFAEAHYAEGVALSVAADGALLRAGDDPNLRVNLCGYLGKIYGRHGDFDEARAQFDRAIAIKQELFGAQSSELAISYNNLGNVFWEQGERDEAGKLYQQAADMFEATLGRDHPLVARALTNLGNVAVAGGNYEKARAYYERAVRIKERTLGANHPSLAASLTNMGEAFKRMGRFDDALEYHQRALAILTRAHGDAHPYVGAALVNIGSVYYMTHRDREALEAYQRALGAFTKPLGPEHPHVAYALTGIGDSYLALGELDEAIPPLERALRIRENADVGGTDMAETRFALAEALWDARRDRKRAVQLAKLARDGYAAAGAMAAKDLGIVERWLERNDRRR